MIKDRRKIKTIVPTNGQIFLEIPIKGNMVGMNIVSDQPINWYIKTYNYIPVSQGSGTIIRWEAYPQQTTNLFPYFRIVLENMGSINAKAVVIITQMEV